MGRFPLTKQVNETQLAEEIAAELGLAEPPVLSVRQPGQRDEGGASIPGEILVDADVDAATMRRLLTAHRPEESPEANAQARLQTFAEKGWSALTETEREDALQHMLTILGG